MKSPNVKELWWIRIGCANSPYRAELDPGLLGPPAAPHRTRDALIAAEARRTHRSKGAVIEGLAEEALRARMFPGIAFRGEDWDRCPLAELAAAYPFITVSSPGEG